MKRLTTMALLALLLLAGCTSNGSKGREKGVIDSLSTVFYDILGNDPDRALAFTDSLEGAGVWSEAVANCRRAQVYSEKYQPRMSEMYVLRAMKDDQLKHEDLRTYYFAYNLLINAARNMGDTKKELEYATKAWAEARADTSFTSRNYAPDFLTLIGNSQFTLDHYKEGNESYDQAYILYEDVLDGARSFSWIYPEFMLTVDAINDNLFIDSIARVQLWQPRMQQSYDKLVATADLPDYVKDECTAELEITKAKLYAKTGQMVEAEQHYQAFLKTDYAHTPGTQRSVAAFLRNAGKWKELEEAINASDSFYVENDSYKTMEYLKDILGQRFRTQLQLGEKEAALQTANRLVSLLDTVNEHIQRDNAEELAVVYETQEKEQKIVEQQNELMQQRVVGVGIALALVLVFMVAYALDRRRHALRLQEKNAQLQLANARAEESSRMKSGFIRQISHEIRTPLNILSGFTQVVTTTGMELDDATREDINSQIIENTNRITGLVNKMLELSDANSQTVIERTELVEAEQIAALAVENSGIAQASHLDFDMQLSPVAGKLVLTTNQQAATRALTLLLDNARKFTKPAEAYQQNSSDGQRKQATLRVEAEEKVVCFVVEDTGIGIPASESEHIFEEFVQLNEYYDGTGIGLTVARSLARRLGGDIVLDASASNVTRFVMTLPR